jgi:hypothetical protein
MKVLVTSYTFDASAKTIQSASFTSLEAVLLITNVTDNVIIYNFASAAKGGALSGTTITLDYDTTSMDDADDIQILIEDPTAVQPISDNGGSLTVDASSLPLPSGASTAAKQDSGNTSLSSIDGKVPALGQAVAGGSVPVVLPSAQITTLTPPAAITGYATSTKQSDGSQKSQIVDGSGNVVGATSNALDVNIKSGAAGSTQYTEGDTDASITGTAVMWEDSSDTLRAVSAAKPLPVSGPLTDAQIRATPLVVDIGAASVDINASDIEIGAVELKDATTTVRGNILTSDPAGTEGGVVTRNIPSGTQTVSVASLPLPSGAATSSAQTDKSQFTRLTDGTDTALITAAGEQNVIATAQPGVDIGDVTINNATGGAAVNIQDGGNSITVDGTVAVSTLPATFAEDAAHTTGDLGVQVLTKRTDTAATSAGTDGDYATFNSDSLGRLWVRVGGTDSLTPGTAAFNLGKAEDAAHTTGDTGVFALGVRNDTLADVTNTTADYSQLSTDIKGRVITAGAPRSLKGTAQVSLSNTTTETTILVATASTFHDVYGLILANTGATTTKVSIRDDTAGTVRAVFEVPTLETRGFMLPVDSAVPQTAVNKNWTAQCASATTALEVTLLYVSMV